MPKELPKIIIEKCVPQESDSQSYNPINPNGEKYDSRANEVKAAILEAFSDAKIYINPGPPPGYTPKGGKDTASPQVFALESDPRQKIRWPRLGAFEVYFEDGTVLYSKLLTRKWPANSLILAAIRAYMDTDGLEAIANIKQPTSSQYAEALAALQSRQVMKSIKELKVLDAPPQHVIDAVDLLSSIVGTGTSAPTARDCEWQQLRIRIDHCMANLQTVDLKNLTGAKLAHVKKKLGGIHGEISPSAKMIVNFAHATVCEIEEVAAPDMSPRKQPIHKGIQERYLESLQEPKHPYTKKNSPRAEGGGGSVSLPVISSPRT